MIYFIKSIIALNSKHIQNKFKTAEAKIQKEKHKETETRKTKTQKDENLVLPKEQVEHADFYKPVLNKIMTTRE